ncbi:MAG TPA: hypothetical protein VKB88_03235 [Bryobacteraceae bacterium]|nr:hypothetical protein [Bryobacteraceae bacterium]
MEKRQFRVLYRQFLFRVVDLEVLSASAQGDSNRLLGRCATLMIFIGWVQSVMAVFFNPASLPPQQRLIAIWSKEHSLIAMTMVAVGLLAVLSWDSIFPDRCDAMVLAPLPVRPRTVFLAKLAALGVAIALTIAALNGLSGLAWPFRFIPEGVSGGNAARSFSAFWLTLVAAGGFVFGSVLTVQGLAAQLPRRIFLRLSSLLQLGAFGLFVGVYMLEPSAVTPRALADPRSQHLLERLPSYWFWGLFHALNGSLRPAIAPLAERALAGLAIAGAGAATAFLLSYFRTLRRIAEDPDILPGRRGIRWLPPFGNPLQTAIVQFSIRSLLRSRQHRVILAFYLGIGFALIAAGWHTPQDTAQFIMSEMMASSLALCCFVLGMRVVMTIPLDLRANWVFRVASVYSASACRSASRRSLFVLAVLPPCAASTVLLPFLGPARAGIAHAVILWIAGMILIDVCLYGFHKIPFTCSYLPGKTHLAFAFLIGFATLLSLIWLTAHELTAIADPVAYVRMTAALVLVWAALRWCAKASVRDEDVAVEFEEMMTPAVQLLGLTRDGVTVIP